jgi:hypothetical protein
VLTVIVAGGVTLAVLVAGSYAWSRFSLEKPLDQTLRALPGVLQVDMRQQNGVNIIGVTVSEVPDLSKTYGDIERAVSSRMAPGTYRVELSDARDAYLEDLYHTIHFDIAEAMATGGFGQAAARFEETAREAGLDRWKMWVTNDRIYVQLHRQDAYLYQIIERPAV